MEADNPPKTPGKEPPDQTNDKTGEHDHLQPVNTATDSPKVTLTNLSIFPRTPTSPIHSGGIRSPNSPQRDYKVIYREMKRRLNEQAETSHYKYAKLEAEYRKLQKKYEDEMDSYKLDLNEQEVHLATENDKTNETLKEYEEKMSLKEAEILSLKETLATVTQSRDNNRSDYEKMIDEHNNTVNEKDEKIARLEQSITNATSKPCTGLHRITSDENCFRLKPKRTSKITKTTNSDKLECEFNGCKNKDVDLTKCNMCNKWVCESCNDVPVAKFKPLFNKCRRLLFLCKTCDESIGNTDTTIARNTQENADGSIDLLSSLKSLLDNKVSQIEGKIETAIEKKLGEKMAALNSLNEKIKDNNEVAVIPAGDKTSYAKALGVPTELRKIMEETRNDEKIERIEQEKRSQNFIIHGAEEIGDSANEISENDADYINEVLAHLRITSQAESITRLGKPNESKCRVLKIVMQTKAAKEEVMANLRRLKGTDEQFGRISVTDDYTNSDREKIRDFANRAREQAKSDPTRVFKVRGDPKNGLRIISYAKKT